MKVKIEVDGKYIDFKNTKNGKVKVKEYKSGEVVDFPNDYVLTLRKNNLVSLVEKNVKLEEPPKVEEQKLTSEEALIPEDISPRSIKRGKR